MRDKRVVKQMKATFLKFLNQIYPVWFVKKATRWISW